MSTEDLRMFLKSSGVDARFFKFEGHTMSVDAAVRRLGVDKERIIKTILFICDDGSPVMGIVTGDKRVSSKKLASVCGSKKVRMANPVEVKEITGYTVGAVPPVGHKTQIRTFIDEGVMKLDKVIGGGGAINKLLELESAEIKRLTKGEVTNISS